MITTLNPLDGPPPFIRVRRPPPLEPPTDDARRPDDHPVCPGQLALFSAVGRPPAARLAAARSTPAGRRRAAAAGWLGSDWAGGTAGHDQGHDEGHGRVPGSPGRAAAASAAGNADRPPGGGQAARPRTDPPGDAGHGPAPGSATDAGPAPGAGTGTGPGHATPTGTGTGTGPGHVTPTGTGPGRSPSAAARTGTGTAGPATPSAELAAHRFTAGCVEVLNGYRPVEHLRGMASPLEYRTIVRQLTRRAIRVRMPMPTDRRVRQRVSVHGLHVFAQGDEQADAVAVLRFGDSCWALALRFERGRPGWLCTLLRVI